MTIKDQLNKIKDNWLLIVLVIVVLLFPSGIIQNIMGSSGDFMMDQVSEGYMGKTQSISSRGGYVPPYPGASNDFAPEEADRKIIKTAYLNTELERGTYDSNEQKLKAIMSSSGSFILNENSNRYGTDKYPYKSGSYQLKVETTKYDSVLLQLKEIGKVSSFSENTADVTGQYKNTEIELAAEKNTLEKYQDMYNRATQVSDQILLIDKISQQERTVAYMEDYLRNTDRQIQYSTISFSMNEKQSVFANISFVEFSQLVVNFVNSTSGLLVIISFLLPYALAGLGIWGVIRLVKKIKG